MFLSLVKIKKYLIYLFLFLLFNFFIDSSLKANPTFVDGTVIDDAGGAFAPERFPTGLSFNNDGTKMYIVGTESDDVQEFTLTTAFDISTRTYDEDVKGKLGISKNIHGFDLGFNANQTFNKNPNQEAELMLTYNF